MSARKDFAEAIGQFLPDNVRVIDHPKELDALPGDVRAVVMISRTAVRLAANASGALIHSFELVVIEPSTQPGIAEDALDEITDELIVALSKLNWLTWSEATRSTYDKKHPAYKFDIAAATSITKE
jgi:hypothetical protein